ncbi:hypothetical protein D3C77_633690 [compost metagenome]
MVDAEDLFVVRDCGDSGRNGSINASLFSIEVVNQLGGFRYQGGNIGFKTHGVLCSVDVLDNKGL